MKKMKKLASILLAAIMVLAMAVPGMAYTVTITNKNEATTHTYKAYQIFKGVVSGEDDSEVLSNIEWGEGVNEAGKSALIALTDLTEEDGVTARQVAEALEKNKISAEAIAKAVAEANGFRIESATSSKDGNYTLEIADAGYYVIVDDQITSEGETYDDAFSTYIVEVLGDTTVTPKSNVPTSQKKVDDKNDSSDEEDGTTWQDSADYDIGDDVPFQLTGTLPTNFEAYKTYKMVFHDKQQDTLEFNIDSVVVKVGETVVKEGYTVNFPATDGDTFDIEITDVNALKAEGGSEIPVTNESVITVEYTSKLGNNAIIGAAGNWNEMKMEYSNNPNVNGEGTGTTPTDKVVVFTYKTDVDKVDAEGKSLKGAEFTLYKLDPDHVGAINVDKDDPQYKYNGYYSVGTKEFTGEEVSFEFKGIDDGKYILVETKTPDGYNTAEDIEFTVSAEHETNAEMPELKSLKADPFTTNATKGEIPTTKINKETHNLASGEMYTEVVNKKGTTLPETGGIGTTIFYVLGSILVLGAVILLVTKRRMNVEK